MWRCCVKEIHLIATKSNLWHREKVALPPQQCNSKFELKEKMCLPDGVKCIKLNGGHVEKCVAIFPNISFCPRISKIIIVVNYKMKHCKICIFDKEIGVFILRNISDGKCKQLHSVL